MTEQKRFIIPNLEWERFMAALNRQAQARPELVKLFERPSPFGKK
jgi:uncharacterized protein (DUF1778 family)